MPAEYNPTTDGSKLINAETLYAILLKFAEDTTAPREEIIAALGYTPSDAADEGVAGGIATLDSNGKIPATQLPTSGVYFGSSSSTPDPSAGI